VELFQHVVRVDDVAHRLGHLLSLLVVHETMREHGRGQVDVGRHEQARPNDGVEPQYVLADDVDVAGPELGQPVDGPAFVVPAAVHAQGVDTRQVVGQSVDPNVHDVMVGEALRDGDPPLEGRATDRQVPQRIFRIGQASQNVVPVLLRPDEIGMVLDVPDETILVRSHFEKVRLLLDPLEGQSRRGVLELVLLRLQVRDEGLLPHVVPSRIGVQVDVTVGGTPSPQFLGHAFVPVARRPDVVVVRDQHPLIEAFESGNVLRMRIVFGCSDNRRVFHLKKAIGGGGKIEKRGRAAMMSFGAMPTSFTAREVTGG
jgi:hypothetical protein